MPPPPPSEGQENAIDEDDEENAIDDDDEGNSIDEVEKAAGGLQKAKSTSKLFKVSGGAAKRTTVSPTEATSVAADSQVQAAPDFRTRHQRSNEAPTFEAAFI